MKTISTILLAMACLSVYGDDGHAQTSYRPLGNMIIGSDGSSVRPLGDGFTVTGPPPPPQFGQPPLPQRQIFCRRLADTVVCN